MAQLSVKARIQLLLGLILVVYGQTFVFPFIALDDSKHIWQNPYVSQLSFSGLMVFWHQVYYGLFIPIVYDTWALLAYLTKLFGLSDPITGYSAQLFHFTNVFVHAVNALLVWSLMDGLFKAIRNNNSEDFDSNYYIPWIVAGIFALHPLQVESVAWVSGLKDTLSTFFSLLALISLLSANSPRLTADQKKKKGGKVTLPTLSPWLGDRFAWNNSGLGSLASFAFFILALLCKPAAVVVPLAALVLLKGLVPARPRKKILLPLIPWFAAAAYVAYSTKLAQPDARLEFTLGLTDRPLVALASLGFYIQHWFAPFQLSPDYGLSPPKILAHPLSLFWIGLGIGYLGMVVGLALKKQWLQLVLASLFIIGFAPVLGLIPFEFQNMSTVGDRYFYFLPMIGWSTMVAIHLQKFLRERSLAALSLLVAYFAIIALATTRHWSNNESLFTQTINVNPKSYLAYSNLGLAALRATKFQEAETLFKKALEIKPDYQAAISNLGVVYFKQQDYRKAIAHYTTSLEKFPNAGAGSPATIADMHFNLGASYVNTGDLSNGAKHLKTATVINPDHFGAQFNLGRVLTALGQKDAAMASFEQSLRIQPGDPAVTSELLKLRGAPSQQTLQR